MRVLVTGSDGLIGHAVLSAASAGRLQVDALPRSACDLSARLDTRSAIRAAAPDVVIHAAANVDAIAAQRDPPAAHRNNVLTTQNVALACADVGCAMAYLSANIVFDGERNHPKDYLEYDTPRPPSVYGRTKLAGEQCTRDLLQRFYVVRTSWVFGKHPGGIRIDLPQRVMSATHRNEKVTMVTDLWANPTYVVDFARALVALVRTEAYGIYHLTNEGAASPHELASETLRYAARVAPIERAELDPDTAVVPVARNTALRNLAAAENLGIQLRPWREALAEYVQSLV